MVIRALADSISSVSERRLPLSLSRTDEMAPVTSVQARKLPTAEEQGRKAAEWVLSRYSHISHRLFNSNSQKKVKRATEESLRCLIERRRTSRAMKMYNKLKEREVKVCVDTQNRLLDLLAYYGLGNPWVTRGERTDKLRKSQDSEMSVRTETDKSESNGLKHDSLDDVNRKQDDRGLNRVWDHDCRAEKLFEEMRERDAATYEIMIAGMVSFSAYDKAMATYHQMRELGLQPTVSTYNILFGVLGHPEVHLAARKDVVFGLLSDMADADPPLKPTGLTLLALLKVCHTFGHKHADSALRVMREMTDVGVQPSLACYHTLLKLHCADGKPGVVYTIVKCLEQSVSSLYDISNEEDFLFFELAASVAYTLGDASLSERLFALTQRTDVPPLADVCRFLKSILRNLSRNGSFESFFHHYCLVVPSQFVPDSSAYVNFLVTCRNKKKSQEAVRLWNDIVTGDLDVSGLINVSLLGVCSQTPNETNREAVLLCIQSILNQSEALAVVPSRNGVGAVLHLYMRTKQLDEVMVFFTECQCKHWPFSYSTVVELLEMCGREGHIGYSLSVASAMADDKQLVKNEHFQTIINSGVLADEQMENIKILQRQMAALRDKGVGQRSPQVQKL